MSMQKPDAAQIRAAISLLSWENDDLAKACGVTAQSISNIKRGATRPQPRVLSAIKRVLEFQGIEFLDNSGVRRRPEGVEVLNGEEGMQQFWDLVYTFAQTSNDVIIRQNGISEGPLDKCAPKPAALQRERMNALVHARKDIFARAIINEGDCNFLCAKYFSYRWYPKEFPPTVPYYIFGDTVGIFTFNVDPPPKIVLITSATVAAAYTTQFDRAWELAKIPVPLRKVRG